MFGKNNQKINLENGSADEIQVGGTVVIPESRAVQLGGGHWGWVWNRPHRLVIRRDGEESYLPIINLTRWLQVTLYGIAFLFGLMGVMIWKRSKKEVNHE